MTQNPTAPQSNELNTLKEDNKCPHPWQDISLHISPDGNYEQCSVCNGVITKNLIREAQAEGYKKWYIDAEIDCTKAWERALEEARLSKLKKGKSDE